jgi:hypothetical protein
VAGQDQEPIRVAADGLVLLEGGRDTFQAFSIGALADKPHETGVRGQVLDPLIDLPKEALVLGCAFALQVQMAGSRLERRTRGDASAPTA